MYAGGSQSAHMRSFRSLATPFTSSLRVLSSSRVVLEQEELSLERQPFRGY